MLLFSIPHALSHTIITTKQGVMVESICQSMHNPKQLSWYLLHFKTHFLMKKLNMENI